MASIFRQVSTGSSRSALEHNARQLRSPFRSRRPLLIPSSTGRSVIFISPSSTSSRVQKNQAIAEQCARRVRDGDVQCLFMKHPAMVAQASRQYWVMAGEGSKPDPDKDSKKKLDNETRLSLGKSKCRGPFAFTCPMAVHSDGNIVCRETQICG